MHDRTIERERVRTYGATNRRRPRSRSALFQIPTEQGVSGSICSRYPSPTVPRRWAPHIPDPFMSPRRNAYDLMTHYSIVNRDGPHAVCRTERTTGKKKNRGGSAHSLLALLCRPVCVVTQIPSVLDFFCLRSPHVLRIRAKGQSEAIPSIARLAYYYRGSAGPTLTSPGQSPGSAFFFF